MIFVCESGRHTLDYICMDGGYVRGYMTISFVISLPQIDKGPYLVSVFQMPYLQYCFY